MRDSAPLISAICAHLPPAPQLPLLWIGPLALARELRPRVPGLLVIADHLTRPTKLARQVHDQEPTVVRALPSELPLVEGGFEALVAVDAADCVSDLTAALRTWAALVARDGTLVLVQQGGFGAVVQRLVKRGARKLTPELITSSMLNAELAGIGQVWPTTRSGPLVSWGRNRRLPAP